MRENEITEKIIGCSIEVHKELGPGLLESSYESCLCYLLIEAGLKVERQKPLPLIFRNVNLDCGYRIDLLVEDKVIVEIKSVGALSPIHFAQALTYLRLSYCKLGLLINFNVLRLREGIRRIANNL